MEDESAFVPPNEITRLERALRRRSSEAGAMLVITERLDEAEKLLNENGINLLKYSGEVSSEDLEMIQNVLIHGQSYWNPSGQELSKDLPPLPFALVLSPEVKHRFEHNEIRQTSLRQHRQYFTVIE